MSLFLDIPINPKYKPHTENYVSLLKKDSDYNTILTKLKTSKYSKTLNISNFKHIRRNNVRDDTVNDYLSKVETYDKDTIVKEYILQYDNIHETINENINQNKDIQKYLENIANEIFMQEKAYTLIKESPKFDNIAKIPYISSYESTYNDNYINIKINMEYLPPVEKNLDITWANTINDIFTYLEENGIYHLDTHPGNVYITRGDKLAIIDFGESRMYIKGLPEPVNIRGNGFPKKVFAKGSRDTDKEEIFESWLKNEKHYNESFGGKNKKRKTKKHRKKRKTQKPKKKYTI